MRDKIDMSKVKKGTLQIASESADIIWDAINSCDGDCGPLDWMEYIWNSDLDNENVAISLSALGGFIERVLNDWWVLMEYDEQGVLKDVFVGPSELINAMKMKYEKKGIICSVHKAKTVH